MTILLTGASGFLGSRIYHELRPNHDLITLGRTTVGHRHIPCDLTECGPTLPGEPVDLVVHAAGKAHAIPKNAAERIEYERVNVLGTSRLLTALEQLPVLPKAVVHISTVLVYGRQEGGLLDEMTPLGATDAYGLSKVRAETVMSRWGEQTDVRVAILRLPLVVAEPPTGNLAKLTTAMRRGYYVRIGDGAARRSMVRADDVAAIILRAADLGGTFNLTDGCHPRVCDLEDAIARKLGQNRRFSGSIPAVSLAVATAVARIGDGLNAVAGRRFPLDSIALQKLTSSLTFSDDAARQHLNWNPRPILDLFR